MGTEELMRVCHVIGSLRIGGAELHVMRLLQSLDRSKYELVLCCLQSGDDVLVSEARCLGIPVIELGVGPLISWGGVLRLVSFAHFLRRRKFKIVHAHLPRAVLFGSIAAWLANVPVIITTEHGYRSFLSQSHWKNALFYVLEKIRVRLASAMIVVSKEIGDRVTRTAMVPPHKIFLIPHGIDPAEYDDSSGRVAMRDVFGIQEGDFVIGTVGGLREAKGQIFLIEAAGLLKRVIPRLKILIVGTGELEENLKTAATAQDVGDITRFLGARRDIPDFLSAIDVFVLPSLREGFGLALLEAMAAGKPVVATDVGGIPEIVQSGKSGLLVPARDAQAIADAVFSLFNGRAMAQSLGEAGRELVKGRFTLQQMITRVEMVYERMVAVRN